ncbi:hypothetical protein F5883DRAFT_557052 [Diaporthe sp. PMI_573]|nr:hypothetical protein F5883DRAFT_557052 [Diaporthaceae sp. PMI_573]
MSDDGTETASIACEPCRHKKCKCDRKLPTCTQCAGATANCHYPEKHRRGIPAGYVNALEKRLAETERALFFALAEARPGTHSEATARPALRPSLLFRSTPTTQQEKAELMALWGKTPLEESAQVEAWFEANTEEGGHQASVGFSQTHAVGEVDAVAPVTPPTEGPGNASSLAAQTHHNSQLGGSSSTAADDGQSRHSGSSRLSVCAQRVPRVSRHSPLSRGSTTTRANLPQMSRASRFANDNKNLYF